MSVLYKTNTHTHTQNNPQLNTDASIRYTWETRGLCKWLCGKESACQRRRCLFNPWVRKILWRRKWQPNPVFLPGESHGQRHFMGYSPQGLKELGVTEHACTGYQKGQLSQEEEENIFFFSGKNSDNERSWPLCLLEPWLLPCPLCKRFLLSSAMLTLAHGSLSLQTLNCNSLLTPNKSSLAEEISGSLFVFHQHMWHLHL